VTGHRLAAALAAGLMLGGCGGSSGSAGEGGTGATVPKTTGGSLPSPLVPQTGQPTAPTTPAPAGRPKTVYGSVPSPSAPPSTGSGGESSPSRAALTFAIRGSAITPAVQNVPPATPFDLTVVSRDGKTHAVILNAGNGRILRPRARRPASVHVIGLSVGSYTLTTGRAQARIRVTAAP
jgi:hypothetical protein